MWIDTLVLNWSDILDVIWENIHFSTNQFNFFFHLEDYTHTRRGYFYTHVMTKNDDDSEILQGKNLPLKNVSSHFDLING